MKSPLIYIKGYSFSLPESAEIHSRNPIFHMQVKQHFPSGLLVTSQGFALTIPDRLG